MTLNDSSGVLMISFLSFRHLPPPPVMWAQRKDKILLTIQLENCNNPTITFKDNSLHFHGKGGASNTEHEVLLEFYKEIDPDVSKHLFINEIYCILWTNCAIAAL